MSNTTLQWQIPLYVVPAQVALFIGVTSTDGTVSVALGAAAALIGVVGALVMRRIELTARWDRQSLDEFEALLFAPPPKRATGTQLAVPEPAASETDERPELPQ